MIIEAVREATEGQECIGPYRCGKGLGLYYE